MYQITNELIYEVELEYYIGNMVFPGAGPVDKVKGTKNIRGDIDLLALAEFVSLLKAESPWAFVQSQLTQIRSQLLKDSQTIDITRLLTDADYNVIGHGRWNSSFGVITGHFFVKPNPTLDAVDVLMTIRRKNITVFSLLPTGG